MSCSYALRGWQIVLVGIRTFLLVGGTTTATSMILLVVAIMDATPNYHKSQRRVVPLLMLLFSSEERTARNRISIIFRRRAMRCACDKDASKYIVKPTPYQIWYHA
jgi:hypothetical protein